MLLVKYLLDTDNTDKFGNNCDISHYTDFINTTGNGYFWFILYLLIVQSTLDNMIIIIIENTV